jgi:16S rRNA (cytidine1402-2'-O)-methyltransferase
MSILYLVATPIGNLGDMSGRGQSILGSVQLIAAEDTRHTGKLLSHFGLKTPMTSYFDHNKSGKQERILDALASGDVALVSDAGTPIVNDPGYELVQAAIAAGHTISPVPGPSAPIAALTASGLPTDRFLFLGYLPRKISARRKELTEVAALPYTLIFLETPHRLLAALSDIQAVLGDRRLAVARELTKLHETIHRGQPHEMITYFENTPPKGEITLVVEGARIGGETWSAEQVSEAAASGLEGDLTTNRLAQSIAAQSGWRKREVYALIEEIKSTT